jgi:hypothetical protein
MEGAMMTVGSYDVELVLDRPDLGRDPAFGEAVFEAA